MPPAAKLKRRPAKKKPKEPEISAFEALRALALGYPGAEEHHPWGETVIKVKGKVFVFLGRPEEAGFGFSVKLPVSGGVALLLPFCEPTAYGLGKAGWVTASFTTSKAVPLDLARAWLDESYRAVAPKKLVAQLPPR